MATVYSNQILKFILPILLVFTIAIYPSEKIQYLEKKLSIVEDSEKSMTNDNHNSGPH